MIKKRLSTVDKKNPKALLVAGFLLFSTYSIFSINCQAVLAADLAIGSSSLKDNNPIPAQFVNTSPELHWSNVPDGTKSWVVIVHDPNAPGGPGGHFTHWLAYDIPVGRTSLPAGAGTPDARDFKQGKNDFGRVGYNGPAPPAGPVHDYFFAVYAMNAELGDLKQPNEVQLRHAMAKHVISSARMHCTFKR